MVYDEAKIRQTPASLFEDVDCHAGTLSNAMTYYVRENTEPRERVQLSVVVRAGSIDELDDERGLAHALEHLAFRARTGEEGSWGILHELEAAGVKFGSHQNAYTSQEETVYFLHVPSDFAERACALLADLVCDIRLADADVDAERNIIIEEWRQGKHWTQRAAEAHMKQTFEGTRLPDRMPIGTLAVISTAPAATLRRFYDRQYRPRAMAVIIAGDFKAIETSDSTGPDRIVAVLEAAFGKYFKGDAARCEEWPRPPEAYFGLPDAEGRTTSDDGAASSPRRRRYFGEEEEEEIVAPHNSAMVFEKTEATWASEEGASSEEEGLRVSVFEDAEATSTSASMSCFRTARPIRTVGDFRRWVAEDVFLLLLNRRLHRRAIEASPPFASSSAGSERPVALRRGWKALGFSTVSVSPRTRETVAQGLEAAWLEVERARHHGFSAAELAVGRREVLSDLLSQHLERDQTESSTLSDECRDHFLLDQPILASDAEVGLTAEILATLRPDEIHNAVNRIFAPPWRKFGRNAIVCCTRPAPTTTTIANRFWWQWAQIPGGKEEVAEPSLDGALRAAIAGACRAGADASSSSASSSSSVGGGVVKEDDDASTSFDEATFFVPPAPPGRVVAKATADLAEGRSALELELENGLRVLFLRTDFKDDEIVCYGVAAGGLTEMMGAVLPGNADDRRRGLNAARLAAALAREYGCFGVRREDMMDAFGGRRCSLGADVDAYRRTLEGECARDELESLLLLVHRLFAATPERDPARLATFVDLLREMVKESWRDPKARYGKLIDEVNTQKNAFFASMTPADVADFDANRAADFFDAAFASPTGFNLVLAGNLPPDDDLERLAAIYLASIGNQTKRGVAAKGGLFRDLFTRRRSDAALVDESVDVTLPDVVPLPRRPLAAHEVASLGVQFPAEFTACAVHFAPQQTGATDGADSLREGATRLSFPIALGSGAAAAAADGAPPGDDDKKKHLALGRLRDHLLMDVACSIVGTRLTEKVRFGDSAAYSISCGLSFETASPLATADRPLEGVLGIYASHDPATAATFAAACVDEVVRLAAEGPDRRELDAALKTAAIDRAERFRRNAFWAPSLALTYINARYNGSVGATFNESCRVWDEVHAALRANPSTPQQHHRGGGGDLLRDAFQRGIKPSDGAKRRTVVTLLPKKPILLASTAPVLASIGAVAVVAAIGAFVVHRATSTK